LIRFFLFFSALTFLFLFTFLQDSLLAQTLTERERVLELQLQQEIQKSKELELKLLEEAYERAIDPQEYIVGPGDFFSVIIWGQIQTTFQH